MNHFLEGKCHNKNSIYESGTKSSLKKIIYANANRLSMLKGEVLFLAKCVTRQTHKRNKLTILEIFVAESVIELLRQLQLDMRYFRNLVTVDVKGGKILPWNALGL